MTKQPTIVVIGALRVNEYHNMFLVENMKKIHCFWLKILFEATVFDQITTDAPSSAQ